jgi:hypothetical protein
MFCSESWKFFKQNHGHSNLTKQGLAPLTLSERALITNLKRRPRLEKPQKFRPPSIPAATMGRLHSNGKGISASAIPYSRTPPSWLKTTPEQVVDQICKLAKKGATPSQIGVVLRDSHGIAQVKVVTGRFFGSSGALILTFECNTNDSACR